MSIKDAGSRFHRSEFSLGEMSLLLTTFHRLDGVGEVFRWSLRTRPTPAPRRKQHAVLSFPDHTLEMQQGGRLHNDGGTENPYPAHERAHRTAMIRSAARRLGVRGAAEKDAHGLNLGVS